MNPNNKLIIVLIILILFDLYSFIHFPFIFYLTTSSLIFISILLYYYHVLNNKLKWTIVKIIFLIVTIIVLFINEKNNCKEMLNEYPNIPFYGLIEIFGLLLFYIICDGFH